MNTNTEEARDNCLRCGKKPRCRGLCANCYRTAWYYVNSKRVTWEQLEKAGKSTSRKPGKGPNRWFLEAAEPQPVDDDTSQNTTSCD